jgi:hypothetical protein
VRTSNWFLGFFCLLLGGLLFTRMQRFVEMLAFRDVHKTTQGLPVQCFGCRKRWACLAAKSEKQTS